MMLETYAPLSLGLIAAALFYVAFSYRKEGIIGRFELFFGLGNLLMLGVLFLIYDGLRQAGEAFADVVFPLFEAMMWIYFLICLVLVFRLLRDVVTAMHRKKLNEFLGF
jgi:hypothetical protein